MYGYIYITTNLINGKKYIGKHKSECFDPEYKGSGQLLWKAINKYGWENFQTEVLKECYSLEELNASEIEEIANRDAVNSSDYYNLAGGGDGWSAQWANPEFQMMMSKLMSENNPVQRPEVHQKLFGPRPCISGEKNPNYNGKSVTEYQRKVLSEMCSTRYRGEGNPMYGKRGTDSPHYGKIHVNNGIDYITIPVEDYESYEAQGYVKTRNPGTKNYCYMNNGVNSILINKSDRLAYEKDGWLQGKKNLPITHEFKRSSTIESIAQEKDLSE